MDSMLLYFNVVKKAFLSRPIVARFDNFESMYRHSSNCSQFVRGKPDCTFLLFFAHKVFDNSYMSTLTVNHSPYCAFLEFASPEIRVISSPL